MGPALNKSAFGGPALKASTDFGSRLQINLLNLRPALKTNLLILGIAFKKSAEFGYRMEKTDIVDPALNKSIDVGSRRVFVNLLWVYQGVCQLILGLAKFCQLILGIARFLVAYFRSRTVFCNSFWI